MVWFGLVWYGLFDIYGVFDCYGQVGHVGYTRSALHVLIESFSSGFYSPGYCDNPTLRTTPYILSGKKERNDYQFYRLWFHRSGIEPETPEPPADTLTVRAVPKPFLNFV